MEDSKRTQNEFAVDADRPTSPLDPADQPLDPNAKFTARRGPRFELVKEEIDILKRFYAGVDERVAPDASEEERKAAAIAFLEEDEEMAALWDRLEELAEGNDESVFLSLRELDRKEAEEKRGSSDA